MDWSLIGGAVADPADPKGRGGKRAKEMMTLSSQQLERITHSFQKFDPERTNLIDKAQVCSGSRV